MERPPSAGPDSFVEVGNGQLAGGVLEDLLDPRLGFGQAIARGSQPGDAFLEEHERPVEIGVVGLQLTDDFLQAAMGRQLAEPRATLDRIAGQLEALSPLRVLARGYSVARLGDGRVARRRGDLPPGTPFTLRVGDGDVPSHADPRK